VDGNTQAVKLAGAVVASDQGDDAKGTELYWGTRSEVSSAYLINLLKLDTVFRSID